MSFLRSSLLAVGIFATAILATTVAFLGARLYSTIDGHLGEYGVQVESDRTASERVSFYSELAEFARNNDFDIAISYSSLAVVSSESTHLRFRLTVAGWNDLALSGGKLTYFIRWKTFHTLIRDNLSISKGPRRTSNT